MKNLFKSLITIVLVLSMSIPVNAHEEKIPKAVTDIVTLMCKDHPDFHEWKNGKVNESETLYDADYNQIATLYTVINKHQKNDRIVGYIIYSEAKDLIIEYAVGDSPYNSALNSFKDSKSLSTSDNELLFYYGPGMYGFGLSDKSGTLEIFNDLVHWNSDQVDVINKNNSLIIDTVTKNTTPVITETTTSSYTDVIDMLADFMNTSSSGSTLGTDLIDGIEEYFHYSGYSDMRSAWINQPSFSSFSEKIDVGRPFIWSIDSSSSGYNSHSMTVAGYCDVFSSYGSDSLICHDTWAHTPRKVYVIYSYQTSHVSISMARG